MTSLLIRGGTVVNADRAFVADVLAHDGKITGGLAKNQNDRRVVRGQRYHISSNIFDRQN